MIEQGKHNELLQLNGVYADLVRKQAIDTNDVASKVKNMDPDLLLQQEEQEIQEQIREKELQKLTKLASNKKENALIDMVEEKEEIHIDSDNNSSITLDAYDLKISKQKQDKKAMKKQKAPVREVLTQMRPEWPLLAAGVLGAMLAGCIFPIYSFLFSKVITTISDPSSTNIAPGPLKGTNLYAFFFFIIGVCAFIGFGTQNLAFEIAGESYTKRLRSKLFAAYMRQEIGFYDMEENNTGALTTKLAVDAHNVNEMVTKVWGDVTQFLTTITTGMIIGFVHSWALALIVLCMAPFIMAATFYESRIHRGYEDKTKRANAESGEVAGEAIREIRTVAALNKQSYFEDRYFHATERPHKLAKQKAYLSSIGYGLSRGIGIYTSAVAFYGGSRLIANGTITFQQMFTTMQGNIYTCIYTLTLLTFLFLFL